MKLSKKTILLLSINLSIAMYAASQRTWYVGLHINPAMYQLYNKNDWNADRILIYPVTGKVNSITIGATTSYIWGKHFGISSGLVYNRCKQEFLAEKQPDSPDPIFYYGITDEFNYLRLPINFEYSTNNNAKHQFVASLGLQTSFLLSYKEHFLQKSTGFYSEYVWRNKNGSGTSSVPGYNQPSTYTEFLYSRFLIGLNSKVAYRLKFNDGWLFEFGVKGEYDLSNAENRGAKITTDNEPFWNYGLKRYGYGGPIESRPRTHNRSLGFYISASIPISVR